MILYFAVLAQNYGGFSLLRLSHSNPTFLAFPFQGDLIAL
jgi:hypothetical protein